MLRFEAARFSSRVHALYQFIMLNQTIPFLHLSFCLLLPGDQWLWNMEYVSLVNSTVILDFKCLVFFWKIFFWWGPFLKSSMSFLQYCFFFYVWCFGHKAWPGIELTFPTLEIFATGLPEKSPCPFYMVTIPSSILRERKKIDKVQEVERRKHPLPTAPPLRQISPAISQPISMAASGPFIKMWD